MSEVLRLTGIARSSWYSSNLPPPLPAAPIAKNRRGRPAPGFTLNRNGTLVPDTVIVGYLKDYRSRPEFQNGGGVDKLRHYLKRDHQVYVNRKKIYRLCLENGLLLKKRGLKGQSGVRRISQNRVVTGPNQLWEFDIKYGYIQGELRFFFILAFVDVFSRKCVGLHVGLNCRQGDLSFVLTQALICEQVSVDSELVTRSDNGPQMRSNEFHKYLAKLETKLTHEFIPVRTPNKNAHVESFFSILEAEFIQVRYFSSFAHAYSQTHGWVKNYNTYRIHGSLGMRTPAEVIDLWRAGEDTEIEAVRL